MLDETKDESKWENVLPHIVLLLQDCTNNKTFDIILFSPEHITRQSLRNQIMDELEIIIKIDSCSQEKTPYIYQKLKQIHTKQQQQIKQLKNEKIFVQTLKEKQN